MEASARVVCDELLVELIGSDRAKVDGTFEVTTFGCRWGGCGLSGVKGGGENGGTGGGDIWGSIMIREVSISNVS